MTCATGSEVECNDIFGSYLMSSSSLDDLDDFDQYRYGDHNVLPIKNIKANDDVRFKDLKPLAASVSEHTVSSQSKESDCPEKSLLKWTWCAQKIIHAFKQEALSSSVDAQTLTKTLVSQLHGVLDALQSCISKLDMRAFCQLDKQIALVAQSLHSITTNGTSMVNKQRTKFVDKLRSLFAEIQQKVNRAALKARYNLESCATKVKVVSAKSLSFLSQAASTSIFDKNFDCESYTGSKQSSFKEDSKAFEESKCLGIKPSLLSSITGTERSIVNKAAPKPSLLSIFDCSDIEEIINQEDIMFNCLCANQLIKNFETNLEKDCNEAKDESTKQVPNLSAHSELKSPVKSSEVYLEKESPIELNPELNLTNISEPAKSSILDCPLDLRYITSANRTNKHPKQQSHCLNNISSQATNEMICCGDFEKFAQTLPIPLVINKQEATAVSSKIKSQPNDVVDSFLKQKPLVSIHPLRESSSHIYSMISSDEASSDDISPIDLSSSSQTSLRLAVSKLREEMNNLDNVLDLSSKPNKAQRTFLPSAPNQTSHKTTQCIKPSTACKETQYFARQTKSAAVQCKTVTKLVMNSDCQTDDIFSSKPATQTSKLQTDVSLLRAAMADAGVQTAVRKRPTLTRVTTVCSMTPYDVKTDRDSHVREVTRDKDEIDLLESISSTSTLCDYEPHLPTTTFHHAKSTSSKASTVSTPSADFRTVASSSDGGGDCGRDGAAYGVLSSEDLASVCRSVLEFLRTNG